MTFDDVMYLCSKISDSCTPFSVREYRNTSCSDAHVSNSSEFDHIPDVNYCFSDCLDVLNCRMVKYDRTLGRCYYYSQHCTSLTTNLQFDVILRECLPPGI